MRSPSKHERRSAFTLVELLVVLGIIAMLISLLLPALNKVRESARRTVCLSRVGQLTQATLLYAMDNNQYLPDASSTNSSDSPLSPRATGVPAGSLIGPDIRVLPSIGALLSKYVGNDPGVWQCPSATDGSFSFTGPDPFSGTLAPSEFKPNYAYMSTKDMYFRILGATPADAERFHMDDWAVRNVAGLKVTKVTPNPRQNPSEITVFYDRSPSYHASKKGDIYAGVQADYWASYGYLDGHAEGKSYRNFGQYLRVFHNPIEQAWFQVSFSNSFQGAYNDTAGY
jgi:prepilin-type N-terminal cleavage/methylation domain-containing protein